MTAHLLRPRGRRRATPARTSGGRYATLIPHFVCAMRVLLLVMVLLMALAHADWFGWSSDDDNGEGGELAQGDGGEVARGEGVEELAMDDVVIKEMIGEIASDVDAVKEEEGIERSTDDDAIKDITAEVTATGPEAINEEEIAVEGDEIKEETVEEIAADGDEIKGGTVEEIAADGDEIKEETVEEIAADGDESKQETVEEIAADGDEIKEETVEEVAIDGDDIKEEVSDERAIYSQGVKDETFEESWTNGETDKEDGGAKDGDVVEEITSDDDAQPPKKETWTEILSIDDESTVSSMVMVVTTKEEPVVEIPIATGVEKELIEDIFAEEPAEKDSTETRAVGEVEAVLMDESTLVNATASDSNDVVGDETTNNDQVVSTPESSELGLATQDEERCTVKLAGVTDPISSPDDTDENEAGRSDSPPAVESNWSAREPAYASDVIPPASYKQDTIEDIDRDGPGALVQQLLKNDPIYPHEYCLSRAADKGMCSGNYTQWSFHADDGECRSFEWGGCHGMLNLFPTHGQCMDTCIYTPTARSKRRQVTYEEEVPLLGGRANATSGSGRGGRITT